MAESLFYEVRNGVIALSEDRIIEDGCGRLAAGTDIRLSVTAVVTADEAPAQGARDRVVVDR